MKCLARVSSPSVVWRADSGPSGTRSFSFSRHVRSWARLPNTNKPLSTPLRNALGRRRRDMFRVWRVKGEKGKRQRRQRGKKALSRRSRARVLARWRLFARALLLAGPSARARRAVPAASRIIPSRASSVRETGRPPGAPAVAWQHRVSARLCHARP